MKAERWSKIEGLFLQAIELPPGDREKFHDDVCCGDEALRKELYLQRDRAEAFETVGRGYAAIALRPRATSAQRAEWNRESCLWLEKSHSVWQKFVRRGVGTPYAAQREKTASQNLASCRM